MRSSIIALAVLLTAPLGAVQSSTFQPAQLQEDLDVLSTRWRKLTAGCTGTHPRRNSTRPLGASRAQLNRSMTSLEFGAILSDALAAIRDGHTRLEYDEATTKALSSARLLPLRVAHEGGRLVVAGNDSSVDRTIRPGMELVSVNGRAASTIVGAIAPKLSG
jgi:hypothetical protein